MYRPTTDPEGHAGAALPLDESTLGHHAARVEVPTYDRRALVPAVVHISVGSFHRAHQAVYFDDLAQRGISSDWGLVGVGLHRQEMRAVLSAQDGLYTVVARGAAGSHARVIGAVRRYLLAGHREADVAAAVADPHTRLVTLTITADAYKVEPATGAFMSDDPEVVADARGAGPARTAIGLLVEALDRRRRAGLGGLTILSCDNVPGNGPMTRSAVRGLAGLRDASLRGWIEENVAFPSSMVDRITPGTTPQERARVELEFGVADRWPVVTEPFSQWVIEDAFAAGRPPLDAVGAQFVRDVAPYSLMKTRLLNASHCALGYLGLVAGKHRIDEAMADPVFAAYAEGLMQQVSPLLPPVPGIDLAAYRQTLLQRFANPEIRDELARLGRRGSAKMPCHVLPSIRDARAQGSPHALLVMAVAGWFSYLRGAGSLDRGHVVDDPLADRLQALARAGGTDPRPLLSERTIFGDLGDDRAFVSELRGALEAIARDGARAAIAERVRPVLRRAA